ncbi:T9SS type A sorting domain-containing protein, partial [Caldithrix abyssi]
PFNPTTTITFFVPEVSNVSVDVYNLLGQKVNTLFNGPASVGLQQVKWNATNFSGNKVPSGVYFYQITYDQKFKIRKKILLIK